MSGPMSPEQREQIAALLGPEQKPARNGLLLSLAESVREWQEHKHPTRGDWFCTNLYAWAGERAPAVLRRLLDAEAEVERLRAERDRYRSAWKSARERSEIDSREAAYWMPLARRHDEDASRLRAELAARPSRSEVLRQEAQEIVAYCPEHGDGDTCWPECHCPVAEDMLRRADAEQGATEAEPGSPTPLRWGLDDVELGDDDSVTLFLSGPDREPYVLEMDADRVDSLRSVLCESGSVEQDEPAGHDRCGHDDYHEGHPWDDLPHAWCPGWSVEDDTEQDGTGGPVCPHQGESGGVA